jgi:hypothetical protein
MGVDESEEGQKNHDDTRNWRVLWGAQALGCAHVLSGVRSAVYFVSQLPRHSPCGSQRL